MTFHQAHISISTIKIIGWWMGAFLIYLQVQVATFTKGFSSSMAKIAWFHHQVTPPAPLQISYDNLPETPPPKPHTHTHSPIPDSNSNHIPESVSIWKISKENPLTTPRSPLNVLSPKNYVQLTKPGSIRKFSDQNNVHYTKSGFICYFPMNTVTDAKISLSFALSHHVTVHRAHTGPI